MFCVENFGCVGNGALVSGGADVILGLIVAIINLFVVFGFVGAFFFLVLGGIKWITSAGDKQGLANARLTITYALLGLILTLISFLIIRVVSGLFNFDLGLGIPTFPGPSSYDPIRPNPSPDRFQYF